MDLKNSKPDPQASKDIKSVENQNAANNIESTTAVETVQNVVKSKISNPEKNIVTEDILSTNSKNKTVEKDTSTKLLNTDSYTLETIPAVQKHSSIELDVDNFPPIQISTDWVAVLGFVITAIIVLISNRQVVKNATEMVASQEELSRKSARDNLSLTKSELTAVNRQAWINTLREDVASYIASLNSFYDLQRIKSGRSEVLKELKNPDYAMKELYDWSCKYNLALHEAEGLSAKVKLLLNPREGDSIKLIELLNLALSQVKENNSPLVINNKIISITQGILKDEWERVKALS